MIPTGWSCLATATKPSLENANQIEVKAAARNYTPSYYRI
jgi:hypothetical protein